MKYCDIDKLKGGEILAKPIMTESYQILLGVGTVLIPEYIEKIRELGVTIVSIETEETEEVKILKKETEEKIKTTVKAILEQHTYRNSQDLEKIVLTADLMIDQIMQEEEVMTRVFEIKERSSDLYEHSVNVCTLSILTALKMNIDRKLIHDIGVASLLHDLGLRLLTVEYANIDQGELSENDEIEYKKHPVYAYSDLKQEKWISDDVKNMILYHHEMLDGTGYPLHAKMLAKESRVLNLCDAFDEMICGIGCKRKTISEAIEILQKNRDIKYDSRTLNALLEFIKQ